jgi:hypothetical protein
MSRDSSSRIFEILKARGLLTTSTQRVIKGFMDRWKIDAFRACIETNVIEEAKMADILSDFLKLQRVHRLPSKLISNETFKIIPYNFALEEIVYPFELDSTGSRAKVAIADPTDPEKLKAICDITGKTVEFLVGERTEIIAAIQRHYPLAMQLPSLLSAIENGEESHA